MATLLGVTAAAGSELEFNGKLLLTCGGDVEESIVARYKGLPEDLPRCRGVVESVGKFGGRWTATVATLKRDRHVLLFSGVDGLAVAPPLIEGEEVMVVRSSSANFARLRREEDGAVYVKED